MPSLKNYFLGRLPLLLTLAVSFAPFLSSVLFGLHEYRQTWLLAAPLVVFCVFDFLVWVRMKAVLAYAMSEQGSRMTIEDMRIAIKRFWVWPVEKAVGDK